MPLTAHRGHRCWPSPCRTRGASALCPEAGCAGRGLTAPGSPGLCLCNTDGAQACLVLASACAKPRASAKAGGKAPCVVIPPSFHPGSTLSHTHWTDFAAESKLLTGSSRLGPAAGPGPRAVHLGSRQGQTRGHLGDLPAHTQRTKKPESRSQKGLLPHFSGTPFSCTMDQTGREHSPKRQKDNRTAQMGHSRTALEHGGTFQMVGDHPWAKQMLQDEEIPVPAHPFHPSFRSA